MSSEEQEAIISAYSDVVKGVYRTVLIGYVLATSLYGISLLQTFFYVRHYSKDGFGVKVTVAILWSLDTTATALVTTSLYTYLISNFGKPPLELDVIPIPFAVENGITTGVIFVVQMFYLYQIWSVSKNRVICFGILITSLVAFALGVRDTLVIYQNPSLAALAVKRDNVIRGIIKGITVLADVAIASSLIYIFRTNRTGIKRTRNILDQLILYAASRGFLLTLCQILYFILFTAFPNATYWLPVHQMISKVYVNSVLASLNVRHAFQRVNPLNTLTDSSTFIPQHHELSNRFAVSSRQRDHGNTPPLVVSKQIEEDTDAEQASAHRKL